MSHIVVDCPFRVSHDGVPGIFQMLTSITFLALLVVAAFALRELVAMRRQVSSIRQFLEWFSVGFLETRKNGLAPAEREYTENVKQDLIREGLSEGTLTEQQVQELFEKAEEKGNSGERTNVGSTSASSDSYAGPKGPPEQWGKRIDSSSIPCSQAEQGDGAIQGRERPSKGRVLIVEDEEPLRQIVSDMLTSAGYECRSFAGGVEALAVLESGERFDLLLTDLLNLSIDGLSLLVRVKQLFPNMAVIVASSIRDESLIRACMRNGASDYLFMPFDREQLLTAIRRAFGLGAEKLGERENSNLRPMP